MPEGEVISFEMKTKTSLPGDQNPPDFNVKMELRSMEIQDLKKLMEATDPTNVMAESVALIPEPAIS